MSVLVSVCSLAYNHEKYIAEAIESYLMQKTNFEYEIIIHDDASTDSTADIIREYAGKYPDKFNPVYQTVNQFSKGASWIMYHFLFKKAQGKYIALNECDDYWDDPLKLQKQVDYLESHPDCSMCFHSAKKLNEFDGSVTEIRPYQSDCISPTADIIRGDGGFMATNSILFRKSIVEQVPDFFLNAPVYDYPLQMMASISNYAYYLDESMSTYRHGVDGSWSKWINERCQKRARYLDHTRKTVIMLKDFNTYSKYAYSKPVKQKIRELRFEVMKHCIMRRVDFIMFWKNKKRE